MKIQHFFDKDTSTLTYVVHKEGGREAIIIDPVWDYDPASGRLSEGSVQRVLEYLKENQLSLVLNIETHAHADHISGSQVLKKYFPAMQVGISARIKSVQEVFAGTFNVTQEVKADGSQFDRLFEDGEAFVSAGLNIKVIPTPGHTPACTSYLIEDALFTGDSIFMPDSGTGRCDFPAGSAKDLYRSIHGTIYSLPESTRIYVGHDYQPGGRELQFESSVGAQKQGNIHIQAHTTESEFVAFREQRDATLSAPRLLLPSIQLNIRAGKLPEAENNGKRYLKIPLKVVGA